MITEVIYFLNELDILEAHLEQHRPWGWRTVIVESDVTVSGIPKPRFFQENKSRFERFDLEHMILPDELFPLIQGEAQYAQFRKNDWAKRLWMHENFDAKNPWTFYSDVDEIIKNQVMPADLVDMEYICFVLTQFLGQVNRRISRKQHAYRLVKSDLPIAKVENVKSTRRTNIRGEGLCRAGWHFTNCPSSPEEARLKAQCRAWYYGVKDPYSVPSVEFFEDIMNMRTPVDFIRRIPIHPSKVISLDNLPVWMQENIHLFPVVEETNEQDVVVE